MKTNKTKTAKTSKSNTATKKAAPAKPTKKAPSKPAAKKPAPAKPAKPASKPKTAPVPAKAPSKAAPFAHKLRNAKLTGNEQDVLLALAHSASGSGYDFCYSDDALPPSMLPKSLAGVIASLSKKGLVSHTNNEFGQCYVGNPSDSTEHKANCLAVVAVFEPVAAPAAEPEPVPAEPAPVDSGEKVYTSKTSPDSRYHNPVRSTIESPVALMKNLCEKHYPKKTRKEIIDMGIAKGVSRNTAMTQFAMWKARKIKDGTLPAA